ncbi:MAG: beta-lactamase family protein [Anaerolineae bacterium]|nr:beta-lactamase family protein [Anaerolineae bacterium]
MNAHRHVSQAPGSGSFDTLDAYVSQQMERLRIPGAALAVVEGDRIVHLRGFGRARPGGQAPSAETPFVLGSTTKSFTALAVMQLVEAGKIDLDTPVQRYLPWFRVADLAASTRMTVRHLLNQTSGLPGLPGMTLLANFDASPGATKRQAQSLSTLALSRQPGAAFEYSNLNYNLLGLVVEAASGQSYADYLRQHILAPLGMRHSYTAQAPAKQNGLAVGHRYWFAHPVAAPDLAMPGGSLPSGQLISCAEDMARYLLAHLNGGRCGDAQILSAAGMDELHRGAVEAREMGISVGQYGMGWFVDDSGPTRVVWHGGNVPDFSSFMALLPGQQRGIVLLINADHYGLPPVLTEVGMGMTALLAGRQPAPIRLAIIPWVMRAMLLIPLLQMIGAVATLLMLGRWRRDPAQRPGRGRMWGLHVLFPLIPNLSLAALPAFLRSRRMFGYLFLFMPDFAWIALVSGGIAAVWSVVRTVLILHSGRQAG